jgi:flagellar protein FlaG
MGASGASTQLIFFISAIIVSSVVVATASRSVFDLSNGIDDRSEIVKDQLSTEIEVINDPTAVPNDPVLIYVKNVGRSSLNQNLTTVMLDGVAVSGATMTLTGSQTSYWEPTSVLTVSINQNLASGDHTVTVTTENGASDQFDFRI